jgi:hypothetical protein
MNASFTKARSVQVIGPPGHVLTMETLPPAGTTRWVARRKAEVVAAVKGGLLSVEEACERYDLSLEELILWKNTVERSGIPGLRVKQIQCPNAIHERQDKHKARKVPAAAADFVLADRGVAQSRVPVDQQARRALQHQVDRLVMSAPHNLDQLAPELQGFGIPPLP